MRFKLDFADFILTDADTMGGVTWKREINSGEDFSYGTAAMAEVKFAILAKSLPSGVALDDRVFDLYISQVESGDPVWEDYGIFTVKTVVKSGHKLEVTAYDNMHKFDIVADDWIASLTFPINIIDMVASLCDYCGVPFVRSAYNIYEVEDNFSVSGITGRQVLAFAAEAIAAFAVILTGTRRGYLSLMNLSDSGVTVDRSMYRKAKFAEYTVLPIDKVQIRTSENDIGVMYGTGNNVYVIENNPLLYPASEAALSEIVIVVQYAMMSRVTYVPATVELFRDFGIDTGEYYTVNGMTSLVTSKTMHPGGVTFTCTGNPRRSQTVSGQSYELKMLRGRSNVLERTLEQTLSRITDAEGSISTLEQTANGLSSRVSTAEGNISTVSQTANKVNWLIKSGTSSSNFEMTDRAISLVAQNINLTGYVTFTALSTAGQTAINGSNITTGTISADRIGANNGNYITFKSPIYMNASYADIYNLNSLQFGGNNCWVRGNDDIAGSNAVQIRATGGLYYHNGTYNYAVLHAGNIASYVTFQ